jgi:rubrerythrin
VSAGPRTLEDFMALALLMEREAVERYTEFADAMEVHNNKEVAAMFRTMATYEGKHADEIMAQMGWTEATAPRVCAPAWPDFEAPETARLEDVHYLMQPWHALQLALLAEQRAQAFFGQLAQATTDERVRRAALDLQQEEREHVALVRQWMSRVPEPNGDWAVDPDPPHYTD